MLDRIAVYSFIYRQTERAFPLLHLVGIHNICFREAPRATTAADAFSLLSLPPGRH